MGLLHRWSAGKCWGVGVKFICESTISTQSEPMISLLIPTMRKMILLYFCHSLKPFCLSLEFQFNVLEMLLIQSSDADLDCMTFANGKREAEMVT